MEKALISGKMEESIQESGKKIRWREKGSSHGQMDANMKVSIGTIKRRV